MGEVGNTRLSLFQKHFREMDQFKTTQGWKNGHLKPSQKSPFCVPTIRHFEISALKELLTMRGPIDMMRGPFLIVWEFPEYCRMFGVPDSPFPAILAIRISPKCSRIAAHISQVSREP